MDISVQQLHYLVEVLGLQDVVMPVGAPGIQVAAAVGESSSPLVSTQGQSTIGRQSVQLAILMPNDLVIEGIDLVAKMMKAIHLDRVLTIKLDVSRCEELGSTERQKALRSELEPYDVRYGVVFGECLFGALGLDTYGYSDLFGRFVEVAGVRWLITHDIASMLSGDFNQVRGHKAVTWNHLKELRQEWTQ